MFHKFLEATVISGESAKSCISSKSYCRHLASELATEPWRNIGMRTSTGKTSRSPLPSLIESRKYSIAVNRAKNRWWRSWTAAHQNKTWNSHDTNISQEIHRDPQAPTVTGTVLVHQVQQDGLLGIGVPNDDI